MLCRYRGGPILRVIWVTPIFNFSRWFLVEIVENRRGRLSRPFLSPGDNFSKRYDENRLVIQNCWWSENQILRGGPRGGPCGPCCVHTHSRSDQIWFSSYFFEKLSPGLKNGPESCRLRFSTISTKNHLLKLNIDKIMAIRVPQIPPSGAPPLYSVVSCMDHGTWY